MQQTRITWALWGRQYHDTILSSRNLKTTCCTAWYSHQKLQCKDFTMFGYQSEDSAKDSKRVGQDHWRQDSSAASLWSFWSKKKKKKKKSTAEFVCKIQAMIYNDHSKSIKSIAKNQEMSKFLIGQIVHEDIWYFSHKMRKVQFLSRAIKDKRKDHTAKLLNKSIPSNRTCFVFSTIRKACSVPTGCSDSDEKSTSNSQHDVWCDLKQRWCYVSIHHPIWSQTQHRCLHQVPV